MICCSACSSVTVDALTLSIRPLRPWVPLFQASILSSVSSDWWMANTGPSAGLQVRAGHDDRHFDEAVGFGLQTGHFQSSQIRF